MVGVGIGGAKAAENELNKPAPTGFFGSIMISAREHGYQTSVNMYDWITGKAVPPAEVLTKGMLMTRANQAQVRKAMGQ
jgi:L-arabinose transport system substrate-binding protein